tara:strand:+ start:220 stop:681 length:462 start_codon:yes stop_codon:yes gene_type:complete
MAIEKVIIRDFAFEVDSVYPGAGGPSGTPVWVSVGGNTGMKSSEALKTVDVTDKDDAGHEAHLPSSRSKTFTIDLLWMEDPSAGTRDPGQILVEALGSAVGTAGLGYFRVSSPGAGLFTFLASVKMTKLPGGDESAEGSYSMELKVSGLIAVA